MIGVKVPIKNLDLSLNKESEEVINASIKDFKVTSFILNQLIKVTKLIIRN